LCKPADYCVTSEEFLKDGHEFVAGDFIFSSISQEVYQVNEIDCIDWNAPGEYDNVRYVLRAAELDNPQVVEWKNGDTVYVENCTHDEIKFIGLSGNNAIAVCECITNGSRVILDKFWVSELLKDKPETPEQRKERERLESAYDLYCYVQEANNRPVFTFTLFCDESRTNHKADYLLIVDKTKYSKGD
jgi:hypothetical protein